MSRHRRGIGHASQRRDRVLAALAERQDRADARELDREVRDAPRRGSPIPLDLHDETAPGRYAPAHE